MFILKIRNWDVTVIASNEKNMLILIYENFEKTNVTLGVHKFKASENCTLNN